MTLRIPSLLIRCSYLVPALVVFLAGCSSRDTLKQPAPESKYVEYARGFSIADHEGYRLLSVYNPWQQLKQVELTYVLCSNREKVPENLEADAYIQVPVKRVVATSTTHVAMISALERQGSVVGLSGSRFISDPLLREKIDAEEIRDIGYEQSLNFEELIGLDPDLVIMYGVSGEISSVLQKIESLDIPVVLNAEYLESDPLAKTEWVKFIACFYDCLDQAMQLFDSISVSYNKYAELARSANKRPTVLSGLPWKDTWWVPGGRSFAARLISDAGGKYVWETDTSKEAIPLDTEVVFSKAREATIWINAGAAASLSDISSLDTRLQLFDAFTSGNVYNNNARMNELGGNAYWEKGVMEPHIILQDMLSIFHPELLPDHKLFYYKRLTD